MSLSGEQTLQSGAAFINSAQCASASKSAVNATSCSTVSSSRFDPTKGQNDTADTGDSNDQVKQFAGKEIEGILCFADITSANKQSSLSFM